MSITHADPIIEVSAGWLRLTLNDQVTPIYGEPGISEETPQLVRITIVADNRSVTYDIREYHEDTETFILSWPD